MHMASELTFIFFNEKGWKLKSKVVWISCGKSCNFSNLSVETFLPGFPIFFKVKRVKKPSTYILHCFIMYSKCGTIICLLLHLPRKHFTHFSGRQRQSVPQSTTHLVVFSSFFTRKDNSEEKNRTEKNNENHLLTWRYTCNRFSAKKWKMAKEEMNMKKVKHEIFSWCLIIWIRL